MEPYDANGIRKNQARGFFINKKAKNAGKQKVIKVRGISRNSGFQERSERGKFLLLLHAYQLTQMLW